MHIAIVHIRVNQPDIEEFKIATIENVTNSLLEPGVARFDFLQSKNDTTWFILYEVYITPNDQIKHRETQHYLRWKEKVAPMMAMPREGLLFSNIFPFDEDWKKL